MIEAEWRDAAQWFETIKSDLAYVTEIIGSGVEALLGLIMINRLSEADERLALLLETAYLEINSEGPSANPRQLREDSTCL